VCGVAIHELILMDQVHLRPVNNPLDSSQPLCCADPLWHSKRHPLGSRLTFVDEHTLYTGSPE